MVQPLAATPKELVLVIFGMLVIGCGVSTSSRASHADSAKALIKFLTYQSGRSRDPGWPLEDSMGLAHEDDRKNRATAQSLVSMGELAVPHINEALASLEEFGQDSKYVPNSGWVLLAYARINGPRAYPRLRSLIQNPKLEFMTQSVDRAIALSLGLTSYVSGRRPRTLISGTPGQMSYERFRLEEPRDALDHLIAAWEMNDLGWLEESLGPRARASLATLLDKTPWTDLRAEIWRGPSGIGASVGYRFLALGPLSEPEETLKSQPPFDNSHWEQPDVTSIQTNLTNRSGLGCGERTIYFDRRLLVNSSDFRYFVDNPNIGALLAAIAACAIQ